MAGIAVPFLMAWLITPTLLGMPGLFAADAAAPDPARAGPVALLKGWNQRNGIASTATSLAVFWGEALWAKGAAEAKAQGLSVWDWM
ncbi:hypothetical protein ABTK05_19885, partial [Acinetobacter baumannii]